MRKPRHRTSFRSIGFGLDGVQCGAERGTNIGCGGNKQVTLGCKVQRQENESIGFSQSHPARGVRRVSTVPHSSSAGLAVGASREGNLYRGNQGRCRRGHRDPFGKLAIVLRNTHTGISVTLSKTHLTPDSTLLLKPASHTARASSSATAANRSRTPGRKMRARWTAQTQASPRVKRVSE